MTTFLKVLLIFGVSIFSIISIKLLILKVLPFFQMILSNKEMSISFKGLYIIDLLSVFAFCAIITIFTQTHWGWPWWVCVFVFPLCVFIPPIVESLIVLSVLIYTLIQLFSGSINTPLAIACAAFSFLFILRYIFTAFAFRTTDHK